MRQNPWLIAAIFIAVWAASGNLYTLAFGHFPCWHGDWWAYLLGSTHFTSVLATRVFWAAVPLTALFCAVMAVRSAKRV